MLGEVKAGNVGAGPGLIVRVAWAFALLLIGILAIGLQMDRQTIHDAALAYKVPPVARAYALQFLARDAYENGDTEQGLAYSRSLVLRRPIPAENLALLTYGLLQSRQDDRGMAALLLSARRGWRAPFTQTTMASLALQADDPETAAQRTLALWRTASVMPLTKTLTGQLLEAPGGLEAFAKGMIQRDRWGTDFLLWAIATHTPIARLEALSQAIAARNMLRSCPRLSLPLRKLARAGNAESVGRIWTALCTGSPHAISDFAFNDISAQGPFDWRYPVQTGLSRDLVQVGDQLRLEFRNDTFGQRVLAARMAALAPGQHTIRINGEHDDADLALGIDCFDTLETRRIVFHGALLNGVATFVVPPACRGQEIAITTRHGQGYIRPPEID